MNEFKSHIHGFLGGGKSCSCCRDHLDKQVTRRLARRRLKAADRKDIYNAE